MCHEISVSLSKYDVLRVANRFYLLGVKSVCALPVKCNDRKGIMVSPELMKGQYWPEVHELGIILRAPVVTQSVTLRVIVEDSYTLYGETKVEAGMHFYLGRPKSLVLPLTRRTCYWSDGSGASFTDSRTSHAIIPVMTLPERLTFIEKQQGVIASSRELIMPSPELVECAGIRIKTAYGKFFDLVRVWAEHKSQAEEERE